MMYTVWLLVTGVLKQPEIRSPIYTRGEAATFIPIS